MKEKIKNQNKFINQSVLKITEDDFNKKCFECELCSWRFSVVLIPESCKQLFIDNVNNVRESVSLSLDINYIIAYY